MNVSGSGVVQAASAIGVAASETGTVRPVAVAVGSSVKAGQVLANVTDQGALEGNLLTAEAQLAADEASLSALTPSPAQIKAQEQSVQADGSSRVALFPVTLRIENPPTGLRQGRRLRGRCS
ncbi:MAG: HlyD family efflux transporter periplasmic adaptor subunit [Thermaerobacter sp.]|nr:HlyD family efflux transporter periplasmic adaptor subunit [Thermaerobacter sp.]